MRLYVVTAPRRTCQKLPTCAHSEQALNTKDAEAGGPLSPEDPGQQVVAVNIMICVGGKKREGPGTNHVRKKGLIN